MSPACRGERACEETSLCIGEQTFQNSARLDYVPLKLPDRSWLLYADTVLRTTACLPWQRFNFNREQTPFRSAVCQRGRSETRGRGDTKPAQRYKSRHFPHGYFDLYIAREMWLRYKDTGLGYLVAWKLSPPLSPAAIRAPYALAAPHVPFPDRPKYHTAQATVRSHNKMGWRTNARIVGHPQLGMIARGLFRCVARASLAGHRAVRSKVPMRKQAVDAFVPASFGLLIRRHMSRDSCSLRCPKVSCSAQSMASDHLHADCCCPNGPA